MRGNALFIILIVVALFAALSYAVTRSGTGGGNSDSEIYSLKASVILQRIAQLQSDANRFALSIGGMENIVLAGANSWDPCTTGPNCLWSAEGGGLDPEDFDNAIKSLGDTCNVSYCRLDYFSDLTHFPSSVAGTAANDIKMIFFNLNMKTCEALAKIMGAPPVPILNNNWETDEPVEVDGHNTGCEIQIRLLIQ